MRAHVANREAETGRESAAYINYNMHKKHVNYYYISFTFNKLQIPLVFFIFFSTGSVRARPNRTLELTRRDCVCSLTAVRLRERARVATRERGGGGSLLLLLLALSKGSHGIKIAQQQQQFPFGSTLWALFALNSLLPFVEPVAVCAVAADRGRRQLQFQLGGCAQCLLT